MRFAIVSDSHDHTSNLKKIINWLNQEKIELMLHCGDICRQATIEEAEKEFKGEIKWVKGNGDYNLDIPETMELNIGDKKIFFNHYPEIAKQVAATGKYDIFFYGHTHRPWEETINNCRVVNPGEVAGQRYKPTFALYTTETNHLELKILELL